MLFSDASSTGCGAFIQGSSLVCHRNWSTEESQKSSTWRELFAIKFALNAFDSLLVGQRVRCFTDNQNVVRIVQVGSMVKELHDIALDVFLLTSQRNIQLDVNWLPREQNSQADFVSKIIDFDDYSVMTKFSVTLMSSGAHILLTDLPAVTIPSCPGLIPDFSSQVRKLLMLFCRTGPRRIIGLFHQLY